MTIKINVHLNRVEKNIRNVYLNTKKTIDRYSKRYYFVSPRIYKIIIKKKNNSKNIPARMKWHDFNFIRYGLLN